jgi:hypothetical protein
MTSAHRTSRSRRTTRARPRHGRVLTECIVALGLVTVAISGSLTLSRAALLLSDEARLLGQLGAAAGALAERATADACGAATSTGTQNAPRVQVTWTDAISPPAAQSIRQRHLDATLYFTPLAGRDSTRYTIDAAGVCPW